MHFRYGEIFYNYFIANLLLSVTVKEFLKSVNISLSYEKNFLADFLFLDHSELNYTTFKVKTRFTAMFTRIVLMCSKFSGILLQLVIWNFTMGIVHHW